MTRLLSIAAVTAFIVLCTLLPFLPGRYDSMAMPLSVMSQLFGRVGLLLVPVGALWIASGRWSRLAGKRHLIATTALIAASVVWAVVSLGALVFGGLSLGLGAVALWAYVVWRVSSRLKSLKSKPPGPVGAMPLHLVIVPVAVALLQLALIGPATELSRSRAIQNSGPLIADIEQYRAAHGRYPTSLLSANKDYLPSVIGISQFHYEPSGEAYNLFFEQFTSQLDTKEFVMYNPRDQQVMTSHDIDLLQRTPEELKWRRGYYSVHNAPQPHWKIYRFD